jgi:predicted transcriptional regulator
MKQMTVSEYAQKVGLTREAIHYQIKNKKLKAKKKKGIFYIILEEEKKEAKEISKNQQEVENKKVQELENNIKLLHQELKLKNELLESKSQTIEAEKRTNIALVKTCELLKNNEQNLLLENKQIKDEKKAKKGFFSKFF